MLIAGMYAYEHSFAFGFKRLKALGSVEELGYCNYIFNNFYFREMAYPDAF